ncbi:MAG: FAD-dependent oxidoreductase [Actinobacteria bacterium]|nr:FAD-dependent oxidoreductase [Actinomycetota bacterium]
MDIYAEYDVVVAGGGTAGVAAAIAAARAGAKTVLVERLGALGGQMNVSGPPGFAYAWLFNERGEQIIKGIIEETHARLLADGHALPHIRPEFRGPYTFSYVDPDWWGLLMFEMMAESGVELLLHSLVVDAIKEGDTVTGVVVENTSGRQAVMGKVVIDCTGEGDLSVRAGAPFEIVPKDQIQPHTLSFTMDGVDWSQVVSYITSDPENFDWEDLAGYADLTRDQLMERIRKVTDIRELGDIRGFRRECARGLETGEWHGMSGVGFFLIPRDGGRTQAHFQHSSHVANRDPTDVRDYTAIEVEGRRQILVALKFIKTYLPGFENAYLTRVCTEARVRESRRIMGDYKLTSEDVVEARKFPDVIGKSQFPTGKHHVVGAQTILLEMEMWQITGLPKNGGSYDIPYRCLVPLEVEGLLVAGKPCSTERDPYMRYLQQTMVTGQAAGVAAAVCAKNGVTPRQLESDVSEVQDILQQQGVVLYGTH